MTELLTAAQMRAIETAAIKSGEVTGLELMERAGRGVVEAVFEEWPELAKTSHRAVILCGPGNNGGDGFVVARLLKEWGWEVEVFLYGDAEKLPPDAKANFERWAEMGEVETFVEYCKRKSWACDLVVDALFGTGLKRGLPELGELFWNLEDMVDCFMVEPGHAIGRPVIVAIDIPSGLCADSGQEFSEQGDYYRFSGTAHLTVSFHSKKPGHELALGPGKCGVVKTVDIGLSRTDESGSLSRRTLIKEHNEKRLGRVVCRSVERPLSPYLSKDSDEHKYTHGHALILSGEAGKTGAARLAARGALRIGAGLVTLGVPHEAQAEVAAQITAIMMREVGDAGALQVTLEDDRLNALCLGPGLGLDRGAELVPVALASGRATVLDADALSTFADNPARLFELLHENCVLTPHEGEFKRLFPDIAEKLDATPTKGPARSKVDATREAAKRAGCTVLFKGPDTVIANQDGRCSINSAHYERSAPWLATAGSGDVLAGFITGLLARGFNPMQAAETAAWLHVECALKFGPGLIAEDLPETLPQVFKDLGL